MDTPVPKREVLFEGLSEEEILSLPKEEIEQFILVGEPIVFRAGSAVLLGSFKLNSNRLIIELAQIEGGGEGVLTSLASLAKRYAKLHNRVSSGLCMRFHVPNRILSFDEFWSAEASSSGKSMESVRPTMTPTGS
jgi:hypothetical protein